MAGPLPEGFPMPEDGRLKVSGFAEEKKGLSAYVHIPFCQVRCGYCDFNTYTAQELRGVSRDSYVSYVIQEIELSQQVLSDAQFHANPLTSIFFGGGTPTLLPAADLRRVLDKLRESFGFLDSVEVTVEANPDTLDEQYAIELARSGFTRVSVGMQSSTPHVLKTLDRTHNPLNVSKAVKASRQAGLDVSVDVIYGTPGETLAEWENTLNAVLELETDHISAYSLIVEEGTALHRRISRGELEAPDDDLNADMYEATDQILSEAGFSWYEISNWAKSDATRSTHNMAYWSHANWWGYGPGAHSHILGQRFWNVKHPTAYAQRLVQGISPSLAGEVLTTEQQALEYLMLALRLPEGINPSLVPDEVREELLTEGLAQQNKQFSLTRAGRLRADEIIRRIAF